MPILPGGAYQRQGRVLEETPASLGEVLGAVAEETWTRSFTPSRFRSAEQYQAETGGNAPWLAPDNPFITFETPHPERVTPISAEDARAQVAAAGLPLTIPDNGTTKEKLDLLMSLKRDELHRQSIMMRDTGGFGAGIAKLATGLGVSVLDPVNIASAFVPVVGEARYAMMLKAAAGPIGRAGVRAGVGAAEGFVGQAILEPAIYAQAQAEQADYTMTDSLMNIAFGTLIGGGLHMGAGAIGDAVSKGKPWYDQVPQGPIAKRMDDLSPDAREVVGRTAVQQAFADMDVNVERLIKIHEDLQAVATQDVRAVREQVVKEFKQQMTDDLQATLKGRLSVGERKAVDAEIKQVTHDLDNIESTLNAKAADIQAADGTITGRKAKQEAKKQIEAERAKLEARKLALGEKIDTHGKAVEAQKRVESIGVEGTDADLAARIEAEVQSRLSREGLNPAAAAVRGAISGRDKVANAVSDAVRPIAQGAPSRIANPAGAAKIAQEVKIAKEMDLAEAQAVLSDEVARLADMEKAIDPETMAIFKDADKLIEEADARLTDVNRQSKAFEAMVNCQLRKGA